MLALLIWTPFQSIISRKYPVMQMQSQVLRCHIEISNLLSIFPRPLNHDLRVRVGVMTSSLNEHSCALWQASFSGIVLEFGAPDVGLKRYRSRGS